MRHATPFYGTRINSLYPLLGLLTTPYSFGQDPLFKTKVVFPCHRASSRRQVQGVIVISIPTTKAAYLRVYFTAYRRRHAGVLAGGLPSKFLLVH